MTKAEFLSLSRDELNARAIAAGVADPEAKTRADLVDLLAKLVEPAPAPPPRSQHEKPRGFFGRARALIARVIERGLHLPAPATFRDSVREASARAPLPTVTLARIYLSQGHAARATEVLREVLLRDRLDDEARELLASIDHPAEPSALVSHTETPTSSTLAGPGPAPTTPPPAPAPAAQVAVAVEAAPAVEQGGSGPKPMLDDAPLPQRYDVDEAVVMSVDPTTAYVYWEIRPETKARVRARLPHARWVVRLWLDFDGRQARRDIYPDTDIGDVFVDELPDNAGLRASLGFLVDDTFSPVAQGTATTSAPATMATSLADSLASWTPAHTELLDGPLPAGVALSIALAHTRDPSLRPQLEVLSGVPGFELSGLRAGKAFAADVDLEISEEDPHEARGSWAALRGADGALRVGELGRTGGLRAPTARSAALGSSDLVSPRYQGSSDAAVRPR